MLFYNLIVFGLCAFLALAAEVPRQHKVDVDKSGLLDAYDLRKSQEFHANAASRTNVQANTATSGQNTGSWKTGDNGTRAFANNNEAKSVKVGNTNQLSATNQNGQTAKMNATQVDARNVNFMGTNVRGQMVNGTAVQTGTDDGRVKGVAGSAPWVAEKTGGTATAQLTGGNQVRAENVNDRSNIKLYGTDGTQYNAGINNNGASITEQAKYAWLPKGFPGGGNTYSSNTVNNGNTKNVTIVKNSQNVYNSQINSQEKSATLLEPNGKGEIAKISVTDYKEDYCPEDKYNNQFDEANEFKIDKDSVKVELKPTKNATGHLEYTWPGCFDIYMNMILPQNIDVKTLAFQLDVNMPQRQKFQCPDPYNCGDYKCFYKDLCNSAVNTAASTKLPVNSLLSNSDNNACTAQQGRVLPFKSTVCPVPDEQVKKDPNYKAFVTNYNFLEPVLDDVIVTMTLYTVKGTMACTNLNKLLNKIKYDLTKVGCRQGTVSYAVRYFGKYELSARQVEDNLWGKNAGSSGTAQTTVAPVTTTKAPTACSKPAICSVLPTLASCKC